jgi:dipeptidyl-peptidase-4
MKSRQSMSYFSVLMLLILSTVLSSHETLTVEWIYSETGKASSAVPRFMWLQNNLAVLYDVRQPADKRRLEIFDPKSGARQPMFDQQKALVHLKTLQIAADSLKSLGWPEAFHPYGKSLIYLFDNDIFLLDVKNSTFHRLTDTPDAAEKAIRFSPDGEKIAFVRENDLYVYRLDLKQEVRLTDTGSESLLNGTLSWVYWEEIFGRNDIGYWWSPDSRALAFLRTDESMVAKMHFVDFKPQVPRLHTQRYPKAGTANPIVHIGVVNIDNPAPIWMETSGDDYEYICRVKWLPDAMRLSVQTMNRAQTRLDLYWMNRLDGKSVKVMSEIDTAWVNINDDLYFLKRENRFVWQSERDGYAHLYRFDMEGNLVNQITRGNWAVRASGGVFWLRQAVSYIDERNRKIYFTALKKSSIERHLYRINFDGTGLKRLTTEDGVHQISFSPNGEFYFDVYSNHRTMPALRLHEKNGTLRYIIAAPRPELIAQFDLQYPELFTIPNREGFPMPAEILKPKDFNPNKKYPVIYYVYGGPSAPTVFNQWRGSSLYFDNILLQRGYIIVRFDHPASTAISKILENRLNKLMSGPREVADIVDGIRWLKSQPYVDANRIGVWGWSGGGSFTLNLLTNTKEFKAGIAGAPVTDWHYYDTKWAEFAMKRPQDNPEGYEKTSFVKSAKNLHGRLLLIHGTYDDNVHPQNSWAFIDELIKHNIMFDMMFYPMRKHGFTDDPARIHLYNKILEFWQKNL